MTQFNSEQKAIDTLLWKNFEERKQGNSYKLFKKKGNYAVLQDNFPEGMYQYYSVRIPRKDYSKMKYDHINEIAQDESLLKHWEVIRGMISVIDGEILRYILQAKIPIEKFIRHELASRGFDQDHNWVGFEKAEKIWLK